MCKELDKSAKCKLPLKYHFRNCHKEDLNTWKSMHFDSSTEAGEYDGFMTEFYNRVYAHKEDLFYQKCLFVCDNKTPIATGSLWKAYDKFQTVHWLKAMKDKVLVGQYYQRYHNQILITFNLCNLPSKKNSRK